MFLSVVSPGFFLVLDPRGRLGGLGEKVGSVYEESEFVYWVNVSESSGASSSGLLQINGH